jgi:hypothetical protein
MRKAIKLTVLIVALMLALPVIGFIGYDIFCFQLRHAEIEKIIVSATEEDRNPPESVVQLLHIANPSLTSLASRILVTELDVAPKKGGMLLWHATGILWRSLVSIHLSEQEQITIIASRSYMGFDHLGFSAAAMSLYTRPLSSLSTSEAASIVALPFAPSHYINHPEALAKKRDSLLMKLQEQ